MFFFLGCAVGSQGLRPASTSELCLRCRSTFLTYSVNERMPTWWAGISRQAGCAGAPLVAPGGGRFRSRLGAWTQRIPLASPRAEESSRPGRRTARAWAAVTPKPRLCQPPERYSRAPPAPSSQGHLSGRGPRPKAQAQTARRITSATAAGSAVATAREPSAPAGYVPTRPAISARRPENHLAGDRDDGTTAGFFQAAADSCPLIAARVRQIE